jgi:hypothetical protein
MDVSINVTADSSNVLTCQYWVLGVDAHGRLPNPPTTLQVPAGATNNLHFVFPTVKGGQPLMVRAFFTANPSTARTIALNYPP